MYAAILAVFVLLSVMVGSLLSSPNKTAAENNEPTYTVETIGMSVENRPIEAYCFGSGGKTIVLAGGLHTGTESNSVALARRLIQNFQENPEDIPKTLKVCIVAVINPDGLANGTHQNAHSVNLNRNWPTENWERWAYHPSGGSVSGGTSPLSEPETKAFYDFVIDTQPVLAVVYHCCGSLIEANEHGFADAFGEAYAQHVGYDYIEEWDFYPITGQFIDAMEKVGIGAFDVELKRRGETDFENNLVALQAMLRSIDEEYTSQTKYEQLTISETSHYALVRVTWRGDDANPQFVAAQIASCSGVVYALYLYDEETKTFKIYFNDARLKAYSTLQNIERGTTFFAKFLY